MYLSNLCDLFETEFPLLGTEGSNTFLTGLELGLNEKMHMKSGAVLGTQYVLSKHQLLFVVLIEPQLHKLSEGLCPSQDSS